MTGPSIKVVPYGESGLLVDLPDLDSVLTVYARLRARPPAGVAELVPGARTLLLLLSDAGPDAGPDALVDAVTDAVTGALAAGHRSARPGGSAPVELPVTYDGADLAEVAGLCGLTVPEVIARHCRPTYTVGFCGFAPGFCYLVGLDPQLQVPRLRTPRPRVPAGAVGVAAEFTAVYPRPSPGGWRLLGHTDAVLFDPAADPPARLAPGTRVRFRASGGGR